MGAAVDCELIGTGLLGQPANALSTIALVGAGIWVVRTRPRVRWVGVGLIATGVGSFLFHGPMPPGSEWAHDVTLAWLIVLVGSLSFPWERWSQLPVLGALGLLFYLAPAWADPISVVFALAAIVLVIRSDRAALGPVALIAIGAVIGRLGATGGIWCDPESPFQPHALWHLAAAAGVLWWATSFRSRIPTRT